NRPTTGRHRAYIQRYYHLHIVITLERDPTRARLTDLERASNRAGQGPTSSNTARTCGSGSFGNAARLTVNRRRPSTQRLHWHSDA
ncbi:MAG TPA: hypothetical protein VGF67_07230, partial [Ktedonobacteraceae bacterium]